MEVVDLNETVIDEFDFDVEPEVLEFVEVIAKEEAS
jgi:hypothetical protein